MQLFKYQKKLITYRCKLLFKCPNASQKAEFISAVKEGYITWHAGPMNLEVEMVQDSWLFDFAIELSKSLDKRFGIQRNTLVLSQRDVPGKLGKSQFTKIHCSNIPDC